MYGTACFGALSCFVDIADDHRRLMSVSCRSGSYGDPLGVAMDLTSGMVLMVATTGVLCHT
jgi:hypothetical protein